VCADVGLKVTGGKMTPAGRLGAFITKVKRGSIADVVGQLKSGQYPAACVTYCFKLFTSLMLQKHGSDLQRIPSESYAKLTQKLGPRKGWDSLLGDSGRTLELT